MDLTWSESAESAKFQTNFSIDTKQKRLHLRQQGFVLPQEDKLSVCTYKPYSCFIIYWKLCHDSTSHLENGYPYVQGAIALFSGRGYVSVPADEWSNSEKEITSSDSLAVYLGPVREEHAPLYCPFTPQIWAARLLQNAYSPGDWLPTVKVQVTSSPGLLLLLLLPLHHHDHPSHPAYTHSTSKPKQHTSVTFQI